ncbi:metallophosphoesterase family protein [Mesorhizobium sp.]|uniref:metallophosphoesterase family protein n=1 Tax=Mesorhizobium sp. TaxID=1871066 RepID=UPI0012276F5D|nr:metallophosphoesterase family protein [Mesorhizobium sp.]TIX28821.1 MAG: serine/threonine protein phosphatase [Mesorhizobium sp.]
MSRTYVIADLHGRIDILNAALERVEADASGGTVVFTGDYVDRGPASRQVLERLMAGPQKPGWKWICLKGNHEDMMVGALRGKYEMPWWLGNGGWETLQSFNRSVPEETILWLAWLPLSYVDKYRIYVHAGVDPSEPMVSQVEEKLLWSRVGKNKDYRHPEGFVIHGHTPFDDGPIILSGRMNLDTAAYWTGRLVVAVFDDALSGCPIDQMVIQMPTLTEVAP